MGYRSTNYIALKPGVTLGGAVQQYLNRDRAVIISDERGTLVVYESNFTPMYARDGRGEHCTHDLEEEIAVQRFLCSLSVDAFHMKRAGDQCDYRGHWEHHAFRDFPTVLEIEEAFRNDLT